MKLLIPRILVGICLAFVGIYIFQMSTSMSSTEQAVGIVTGASGLLAGILLACGIY
jgi:hypothetical protein